ncbi:SDR family NAD(P)-dependent oxidoreductase [Nocardia miyunensis]|uniref:SDR family NAD(P)-dependent oxidoreductase n=1 Tax=Nocardia miyunensis TaxID=282684 RepID=UPI0008305FA0|nr:SDR family oxidoreductase [Nocardia miyunensis]
MRTALITGASRGIGHGIALVLAARGYGLTITSRTAEALEGVRDELLAAGAVRVIAPAADMADRPALPGLVEAHRDEFGSMHALIVNAGVGTAGNISSFDMTRFDKTLEVNLASAMVLIQNSIPLLRRAAQDDPVRGAKIIGLSSITGAYAERGLAVYGASKAALLSLLETVNLEESRNGITATALAPAYVDTDLSAWVTDRVPADSMIPVSDVVQLVATLLELTSNTVISRIVMARKATNGYCA